MNQKSSFLKLKNSLLFLVVLYASQNYVNCPQKIRKAPMTVFDPKEVPEYELNPEELHFRHGAELTKVCAFL